MAAISVGFLAACEANFSPVNEERGQYSIYGSLNLDQQQNYIRVKNLNIPFANDTAASLNADVSLQNLNTGETEMLRDSIIKAAGVNTFVFITDMEIESDTEYLATVQGDNDAEVSIQTKTPVIVDEIMWPSQQIACRENFEITFGPVLLSEYLEARISFGKTFDEEANAFFESENKENEKATISLKPYDVVLANFRFPPPLENDCEQLETDFMTIIYTHYGIEPGTSTTNESINVPGGTGEFIGFYQDTLTFAIDILD